MEECVPCPQQLLKRLSVDEWTCDEDFEAILDSPPHPPQAWRDLFGTEHKSTTNCKHDDRFARTKNVKKKHKKTFKETILAKIVMPPLHLSLRDLRAKLRQMWQMFPARRPVAFVKTPSRARREKKGLEGEEEGRLQNGGDVASALAPGTGLGGDKELLQAVIPNQENETTSRQIMFPFLSACEICLSKLVDRYENCAKL